MKTVVLGAGKMVEAILIGLKDQYSLNDFYIYSPSGHSAKDLALKVGANFLPRLDHIQPDQVWLAHKPQQIKDVADHLPDNYKHALFVSMLAAIPEDKQREMLVVEKLIRIMPNLPVCYRKGVTLVSSSSAATELPRIQSIFAKLGFCKIVEESELEELTLLTGSSPAFFYEFALQLSRSFNSLTDSDREHLARMVLCGAGIAAQENNQGLGEMINAVTSKGGVTISVLDSLREQKLTEIIGKAVAAGKKRSEELKKNIIQN
jgi:pyrroline-5-carboxylate reductase